jgi:prephenate dehydratase
MTIAIPGEKGSFTELAAIEYFGVKNNYSIVPDFRGVFDAVNSGKCLHGVVPIENSLAGSIHQNYDSLLDSDIRINGEISLRISHFLIANKGVQLKNVQRVFSHPQPIAQCKNWLSRHPSVESIPYSFTSLAVKKIKEERLMDAAAIASMQAAIDFDMEILASNIEDNKWNTTRFIILSKKEKVLRTNKTKSSIVFSTRNIPGALFKCLAVFALRDIDLFKIESRPFHGKGFRYLFYLDFEGDLRQESCENAINHLKEMTTLYKFLGSYPIGKQVIPKYHKNRE